MATDCDDIKYLIDAGIAGRDLAPLKSVIMTEITGWGIANTQDLTVFIVGQRQGDGLRLSDGETLSVTDLDTWLGIASDALSLLPVPGKLTLIIESDDAGSLTQQLDPRPDVITIAIGFLLRVAAGGHGARDHCVTG